MANVTGSGDRRPSMTRGSPGGGANRATEDSQRGFGSTDVNVGRARPKRTRAHLTIGTLNMRGYGDARNGQASEKWLCINQVVRDARVAILALQETHLTAERIETLNHLFEATLLIRGSCDAHNPTGARGVAFAVNKRLIDVDAVTFNEEEAGRALALTMKWTNGQTLKILNVYAPNDMMENSAFWTRRENAYLSGSQQRYDIVLGDFNVVTDPNDRLPPRRDLLAAQDSIGSFLRRADLLDGWRERNPSKRQYTYLQQATGSQSRIDRIYIRRAMMSKANDWSMEGPGFRTDHRMVTVGIANTGAPHQGKGRWAMPGALLTDKVFLNQMRELGRNLQGELDALGERSESVNPQRAYAAFKQKLVEAARKRAKCCVPQLDRKIGAIQGDIDRMSNSPSQTQDQIHSLAILQEKLTELEVRRFGTKRRAVAANDWAKGETVCKYWTKLNKMPNPSSVIQELGEMDSTGQRKYTTRSDEMARIAKDHYDGLQADPELNRVEQHRATTAVTTDLEAKISDNQATCIDRALTRSEVVDAISQMATGKAPGLDGLPSELWKTYLRQYQSDTKKGRPAFDVARAMQMVYNDIEGHGLIAGSRFAEGWICPIYKLKKDQRDIVNYRPITLLNSDYKIMTRMLAMRVAGIADTLIHRDQAGFVPGRQIFSHIRLSQMMIAYAEAEEVNGMIVALDQEKAYDRIDHEYLWATLRAYGFPDSFVRTVRSLYTGAVSLVMVNGEKSGEFTITRGVRQGDPMSCLLFDIAIEPLATMLRKSALHGFRIPGVTERVLAALFADDTTAYLHESDDYAVLTTILRKWCEASRAKFNEDKTEHIPIGTKAYREAVLTRTSNARVSSSLPDDARIVGDGAAVRSLGAWIGNQTDEVTPWEPIIRTIEKQLERWGKRHPTMYGRKLAAGMEVGGRTQFLAKAQGMPDAVLERLDKLVAEFVWKGEKNPRILKEMLYRPVSEGGLGLLELKARNAAIELTWVRDYLDLSRNRPTWAYIADILLARSVIATDRVVDKRIRANSFLQTWTVSLMPVARLPEALKRMLKAARKYGVKVDAPNPSESLKQRMPVWYHLGKGDGRSVANTVASKCLREKHGVTTVLDSTRVARRTYLLDHTAAGNCKCNECVNDRRHLGCTNPGRCALAARKMWENLEPIWRSADQGVGDGLTLTPNRKDQNVDGRAQFGRVLFDPSVTDDAQLAALFRVFVTSNNRNTAARRPPRPFAICAEEVEVFTDGSCTNNGLGDARAGAGVWFGDDDPRNLALRVPGGTQSNQTGEIFAIAAAVEATPPFATLHVVTDSKYVADGLTVHAASWERRGWLGVANSDLLRDVLARLRSRSAPTTFRWIKGHTGIQGNDGADRLAKSGSELQIAIPLRQAPKQYLREGAALAGLTQKLAYKGIRKMNPKAATPRVATERMISRILESVTHAYNLTVHPTAIWSAVRNRDVPRNMRDFWWKALHDAIRVGTYWEHIPGYEQRAVCHVCGVTESLEHILLECTTPGQKTVWELVNHTLARKAIPPIQWSLGAAMGAIAAPFPRGGDNSLKTGQRRLFRIVVTESIHLIWKLRCHRVIECSDEPDRWATVPGVRSRWRAAMNRRLNMDRALTSGRLGNRGVDKQLVLNTWCGVLADEENLPDDWTKKPGVLVGMPQQAAECGVG